MKLYRHALGEVIREMRTASGKHMRNVSKDGSIAIGYLSEVERGYKEASSEILEGIARALGTTVGELAIRAGLRLVEESVPDSPAELVEAELIPHRG